jgi:hypothetical protein
MIYKSYIYLLSLILNIVVSLAVLRQNASLFLGKHVVDTRNVSHSITIFGSIIMTDYLGELTNLCFHNIKKNLTCSSKLNTAIKRGRNARLSIQELPFPVVEWPSLKVASCPHDDRNKHGTSERGLAWAHYQILLEFVYFDYDVLKEVENGAGLDIDSIYRSTVFSSVSSSFAAVGPLSKTALSRLTNNSSSDAFSRPGLYKNGIPFQDDDIMVILEDDIDIAIKDVQGTLMEELTDMNGIDILYLGWCEGRLARPIPLCSHAYAITRRGARKLIKYFEPCGLAYDWQLVLMIRNKWLTYRTAHRYSYEGNYKEGYSNSFTRGIFQQMKAGGSFNGH